MNIDKDIEILKEFENYSPYEEIGETGKQAIKNTLKELETYKKIAEKLAGYADTDHIDINCSPMCVHDNCLIECIIDWARKEVEK